MLRDEWDTRGISTVLGSHHPVAGCTETRKPCKNTERKSPLLTPSPDWSRIKITYLY